MGVIVYRRLFFESCAFMERIRQREGPNPCLFIHCSTGFQESLRLSGVHVSTDLGWVRGVSVFVMHGFSAYGRIPASSRMRSAEGCLYVLPRIRCRISGSRYFTGGSVFQFDFLFCASGAEFSLPVRCFPSGQLPARSPECVFGCREKVPGPYSPRGYRDLSGSGPGLGHFRFMDRLVFRPMCGILHFVTKD